MRDPATAGTTIEASAAMSAARATTLGSRTSGPPYSKSACSGPTGVPARALQRPRSEVRWSSTFGCAPAHAAAAVRSISGRCWERWPRGSGDPTMRVASGAAIRASITPAGPGSIELRVAGSEIRARAWGSGGGAPPGRPARAARPRRRRHGVRTGPASDGCRAGAAPGSASTGAHRRGLGGAPAGDPRATDHRDGGVAKLPAPRAVAREPGAGAAGAAGRAGAGGRARDPAMAPRGARDRASPGGGLRRAAREGRGSRPSARPPGCPPAAGRSGDLAAALRTIPGIGPWTAAEVTLRALGDPDAVSVGDAHLSNLVTFALTGRPRAPTRRCSSCSRRGRAIGRGSSGLLEGAGIAPPRYGPRVAPRDLARDLTPREARPRYRQRRA